MKRLIILICLFVATCGFIWPFQFSQPNLQPFGSDSWMNKEMQILESRTTLNPTVLRLSLQAYLKAQARGLDNKQILTVIDFSRPSTEKRMWVFDLRSNRLLYNTWVSHGKNSGDIMATSFSNSNSSLKSSIGVFVTDDTYIGKHGYSLRVSGLEHGINDNAYNRDIVFHGASYVNADIINRYGRIGRSWGCFAVTENLIKPIISKIEDNTVVVAYYPDRNWLTHSKFLSA